MKTILSLILILSCSLSILSQTIDSTIVEEEVNQEIYYMEFADGTLKYIVPEKKMQNIEKHARKGILLQESLEESKLLLEQVIRSKQYADSLALQTQLDLNKIQSKVNNLSSENFKLQQQKIACHERSESLELEKEELEAKVKKLERKIFWNKIKSWSLAIGATAAVVLAIFL